jgi:hypothetical protein
MSYPACNLRLVKGGKGAAGLDFGLCHLEGI